MTLRVFIVGAGGWGREVLGQMQVDPAWGTAWDVAGFLDNRPHILDGLGCDFSIVGDPMTHVPQPGEAFVCAVGDPRQRQQYAEPLLSKGATFISVCTEVALSKRVRLGHGCFLTSRSQISMDVSIGDFANIHAQTVVGHDAHIGNYAQIGAMVFIGGGVHIGDFATVHPHATILPGIHVGEGATVGAGAVVVKNVPPGVTVFGNPAKVIF